MCTIFFLNVYILLNEWILKRIFIKNSKVQNSYVFENFFRFFHYSYARNVLLLRIILRNVRKESCIVIYVGNKLILRICGKVVFT